MRTTALLFVTPLALLFAPAQARADWCQSIAGPYWCDDAETSQVVCTEPAADGVTGRDPLSSWTAWNGGGAGSEAVASGDDVDDSIRPLLANRGSERAGAVEAVFTDDIAASIRPMLAAGVGPLERDPGPWPGDGSGPCVIADPQRDCMVTCTGPTGVECCCLYTCPSGNTWVCKAGYNCPNGNSRSCG